MSTSEGNARWIKPGHWSVGVLEAKANNFDFLGRLDAYVKQTAEGTAVDLPRTPYQLQIARPAVLPKGQPKRLEFPLFVPDDCSRPWLASEFRSRGGLANGALCGTAVADVAVSIFSRGAGRRARPLSALGGARFESRAARRRCVELLSSRCAAAEEALAASRQRAPVEQHCVL